ncbi:PREDICTED: putative UPF0481 protein At3g02645 [Theobroma cacao]|uniref:UPF0481 protein At3g02645 n=1 Tax=Theobroma cacao TaxID=3641 RepID=A0AB32X2S5_THECC|nr:PREDICTED: putative UPF0481 protein At3g02645 [Theobroma cacao]
MANTDQEIAPFIEKSQQPQDLAIDIPEEDLEPAPECCIYKVPRRFREAKENAYTPTLISIGPLHRGKTNLGRMESQKQRYYKKFCQRTSKKTLEEFVSFIQEHLNRICKCYQVQFVFRTESEASKFTEMILYDAVFIIEYFLRNFEREVNDFLFHREWLSVELQTDLMLLENQLPFFLLEDLYNLAFATSDKPSFLHLARLYFKVDEDQTLDQKGIKHFTDLIRRHQVRTHPSNLVEKTNNRYSATMLRAVGVRFKAVDDCLLNVKFEEGVLKIPSFRVEYETETVFRNLIAFEQCHYPSEAYFCGYIQLLDSLVDVAEDVNLLIKMGIISHRMGSGAAVANMINNLMVGVTSLCYYTIGEDLKQYYRDPLNQIGAKISHAVENPLKVASIYFGIFTIIQTIVAILDRVKPVK